MPDEEGVISDSKTVIALLKLMNIKLSPADMDLLNVCSNDGWGKHIKFKINENSITGMTEKYQCWHTILFINRGINE